MLSAMHPGSQFPPSPSFGHRKSDGHDDHCHHHGSCSHHAPVHHGLDGGHCHDHSHHHDHDHGHCKGHHLSDGTPSSPVGKAKSGISSSESTDKIQSKFTALVAKHQSGAPIADEDLHQFFMLVSAYFKNPSSSMSAPISPLINFGGGGDAYDSDTSGPSGSRSLGYFQTVVLKDPTLHFLYGLLAGDYSDKRVSAAVKDVTRKLVKYLLGRPDSRYLLDSLLSLDLMKRSLDDAGSLFRPTLDLFFTNHNTYICEYLDWMAADILPHVDTDSIHDNHRVLYSLFYKQESIQTPRRPITPMRTRGRSHSLTPLPSDTLSFTTPISSMQARRMSLGMSSPVGKVLRFEDEVASPAFSPVLPSAAELLSPPKQPLRDFKESMKQPSADIPALAQGFGDDTQALKFEAENATRVIGQLTLELAGLRSELEAAAKENNGLQQSNARLEKEISRKVMGFVQQSKYIQQLKDAVRERTELLKARSLELARVQDALAVDDDSHNSDV